MSEILSIAATEALAAAALERSGTGPEQAASVARGLVAAEAAGQSGHGLRRLAAYCGQARSGKVAGHAVPVAERVRPALLRIDAADGFAFPALDLVVAEMPGIVAETGVAVAAIRRSHHAGVLGLTVERFAEAGLVALMMANSPGAMAAWGGTRPLFGTNPIAFAAPLPEGEPIVVDLSLSKIARGKVMAAKQKGTSIPEGWALDAEGRPTTDTDAALAGTMVPMGDAKGAALALVVEMLSAGLTGANYASEATSLFDDKGPPPGLGQFLLVLDPAAMGGPQAVARLGVLIDAIADEPGTRIPGRRGRDLRKRALEQGIEIDAELMRTISAI
ncbi:Ldh family oxidoreductase [Aurantimonas endophytica]|uniref:(2R)-3-sulfolactate dehydrogenase (NADP+) n=1 Tax=Aurantimonas endophytica TaxID=1522175 RepID=A0A7W6HE54_9HYPH|nr:Ldh family oxidoreductase [Aurantimonas endophytica]MBB4003549.1 (2R)-3-sulfolactate dehydrogenase (NADP+) [Aurantimonas endophytica]MCO6404408.1 Ldh family oxidoreductase [Aurantimonas endophytica]